MTGFGSKVVAAKIERFPAHQQPTSVIILAEYGPSDVW